MIEDVWFYFGPARWTARACEIRWAQVCRALLTHDGLPSNAIGALAEDPDGSIWVGTQNGLARLQEGRRIVETYTTARTAR